MKLILLTRSLNPGGAERQLLTLAKALTARGCEPVVAVFYPGGSLEAELRSVGVRIHNLHKHGRWDLLAFSARLARFARAERPDIVYSMLPVGNLAAAGLRLFTAPTRIFWGIRASRLDEADYDAFNSITLLAQRTLSVCAHRIIVNSDAGKRDLIRAGYKPERLAVVHNGIDAALFAPDPDGRARVRREWVVSEHERLVGIVARFDPMKDHRTFVSMAAHVAGASPMVRFVCIGSGTPAAIATVQEQARQGGIADRFIWAGLRSDMAAVYSALDVCVLSSAYGEGFPNVLAEAQACGVPCVSTAVGDAAQIVAGWGIVVPPRDPRALAAAVEQQLTRTVSGAWQQALRADMCARFSVATMVSRTEEVLLS